MPRVKRGTTSLKRRRNVLSRAKGFRHGAGTKERLARETLLKAGVHAFAHRRDKKNVNRTLWNIKINAALRAVGLTYSKFIHTLKTKNIELDRKILADLAQNAPHSFERLVASVK